jgi:hypothetical protein
MKATTVREDYVLYAECKRLYLLDAHTDPNAAERYLAAIEDIDSALLYIDAHAPNAWAMLDVEQEKVVLEVLSRLEQEGLEFSRSQKGKS